MFAKKIQHSEILVLQTSIPDEYECKYPQQTTSKPVSPSH